MRTLALSIALLGLAAPAHAAGNVDAAAAKITAAIDAKLSAQQARQQGLQKSLRALTGNRRLLRALGKSGQQIVLGEKKMDLVRSKLAYYKTMHLGLTEFTATVADKVARRSQLVLTGRGLEIHNYDSVAPVSRKSIDAYRADLDAQFARKPDFVTIPKTAVEHDAYGPEHLSSAKSVHVNRFFGRGDKLRLDAWSHVDAQAVGQAVDAWAARQ